MMEESGGRGILGLTSPVPRSGEVTRSPNRNGCLGLESYEEPPRIPQPSVPRQITEVAEREQASRVLAAHVD